MVRDKVFGLGRPRPLDREGKVRLIILARILKKKMQTGKHYGELTAKMVDVFEALLFQFHNARTGLCFPSIATIAATAGCAKSTVQRALAALERLGFLTWVNRLIRKREYCPIVGWRWRVYRTSNGYAFNDPRSNAENRSRTNIQDHSYEKRAAWRSGPPLDRRAKHGGDLPRDKVKPQLELSQLLT